MAYLQGGIDFAEFKRWMVAGKDMGSKVCGYISSVICTLIYFALLGVSNASKARLHPNSCRINDNLTELAMASISVHRVAAEIEFVEIMRGTTTYVWQ